MRELILALGDDTPSKKFTNFNFADWNTKQI